MTTLLYLLSGLIAGAIWLILTDAGERRSSERRRGAGRIGLHDNRRQCVGRRETDLERWQTLYRQRQLDELIQLRALNQTYRGMDARTSAMLEQMPFSDKGHGV